MAPSPDPTAPGATLRLARNARRRQREIRLCPEIAVFLASSSMRSLPNARVAARDLGRRQAIVGHLRLRARRPALLGEALPPLRVAIWLV